MFFNKVDDWLIDRAEEFAWVFQSWTGKDNFFLGNVCATLGMVGLVGFVVTYAYRLNPSDVLCAACYLLPFVRWYGTGLREKVESLSPGFRNPLKIDLFYQLLRALMTLTATLFTVLNLLVLFLSMLGLEIDHTWGFLDLMMYSEFLWLLFIACDPLPPPAHSALEPIS